MSGRAGWLSLRIALRLGRHRYLWLLQFPPERRGWLIALVVVMLLVGYVVGAVPTAMVMERSPLLAPHQNTVVQIIYAPLILLAEYVPVFEAFFDAEERFLKWLFKL